MPLILIITRNFDFFGDSFPIIEKLVDKGPLGIQSVFFKVEFIGKKIEDAPYEVGDHDGNDNEANDVVHIQNLILFNNRLIITILVLE